MKKLRFAGTRVAKPGAVHQDRPPMAKSKRELTCEDCYFKQNLLCALSLDSPCTTFRPAERGLAPEKQLAFVFRTERVTAAYAFPKPKLQPST
jgi:hypothetical protein